MASVLCCCPFEGDSLARVGLGAWDWPSCSSTGRTTAEHRGPMSPAAVQGLVVAPKAALPLAVHAVLGGAACGHLLWCTALPGQRACCCQPVPR